MLLLLLFAAFCSAIYGKDPHIYDLNPSNFDKVVHRSNYTSVVKFYAPWCGYCKQLEPVYHKLGKFLHKESQYAVNVAAVNCDEQRNRPLCSKYNVKGFPTIVVFRPPKYAPGKQISAKSRHVPETYNGQRSLKAMADFVLSRMKNYVKTIHGAKSLVPFLDTSSTRYKVVLLTKTGRLSPLYKTIAIDFLGSVSFGYLKIDSPAALSSVELDIPVSELESLPVLLLWDSEKKTFSKYSGLLKKKLEIEEWILENTELVPSEGHLSKKDKKYYKKYRGVHDEL